MLTQRQWKTQQVAEFISVIATSAAVEAAQKSVLRQPKARELAVIAEETRKIAIKTLEAVEKNIFGGLDDNSFEKVMDDIITMSTFLTMNAGLEACKVREHLPLAVFAEELRTFTFQLGALFGKEPKYADIPKVSPKSTVIADVVFLFNATSGKYRWTENALFVQEVFLNTPEFIQGERFVLKNTWRDMDMPVIKMGEVSKDSAIVIISNSADPKKHYAVIADISLHALVNGNVGVNKPCTSDIPVRECWAASDGSEFIFPDWDKIAGYSRFN